MQPLPITRHALVNSLGTGTAAFFEGLAAGRSGLTPCDASFADVETWLGHVSGLDKMDMHELRVRSDLAAYDCRNNRLAQLALEQDGFAAAVASCIARRGADRVGVFMGTSTSGILETERAYRETRLPGGALPAGYRYAETQNGYSLADFVSRYLGTSGPAVVVSSACSSSAKVFGSAARMIEAGVCDAAVVGGVDTLCLMTLYGFRSLQLTSGQPCRPFDADRDGISIGEGAAFALLERGGRGPVALLGVGESSDAHHMSAPHPEGTGVKLAMRRALESAGLEAGDIDYINLHGTGTRANDAAEDAAVHAVFGGGVACSSTKGATGHLLGAAGATEAVLSALAIERGLIPGSVNTRTLDPGVRTAYALESRAGRVGRALSNSFGFGGSNCCLVLGAAG